MGGGEGEESQPGGGEAGEDLRSCLPQPLRRVPAGVLEDLHAPKGAWPGVRTVVEA